MTIRQIQVQDAAKLLTYFKKLVELDPKRVERIEDVEKITLEMEEKWIESRIADEEKGEMYVLCIEDEKGEIIAEGEVERNKRWIERHVGEIRFGVLPGFEEHAKHMVNQLIEKASQSNIRILIYFHLSTQTQGIQIMKDLGFKDMGTIEKYYMINNSEFADRIYLVKNIL